MRSRKRVLALFGTRPEVIKLAPVIRALAARPERFEVRCVNTGQHGDLARPIAETLGLQIDQDLRIASARQTPLTVAHRVLAGLQPLLERETPAVMLVQGDTTTALAGALAGFYEKIPVGHVEAGMRSGDRDSPFPEELNRRLISQLATFHFAATERNERALLAEGVPGGRVVVSGNPVVDSVRFALAQREPSETLRALLARVEGLRLLVVTTHRRESFGPVMAARLRVLHRFVETHRDVALVFPVHPNPEVRTPALRELGDTERVHLVDPLGYLDFVHLLSRAWLVASDSGGVQEEAPSLGVPVLVMRDNTERPEAIDAGVARLIGRDAGALETALAECAAPGSWTEQVAEIPNPFGSGDSGVRIADALARLLDDDAFA